MVNKFGEDKGNFVLDVSNSVVSVKTPLTSVNIPVQSAQVASTAFATAYGMRAGLVIAKTVPGLGSKAALGIVTVLAAQAINITANKVIKYASSSSSETNNSLISSLPHFINENENTSDYAEANKINDKFSEFPYNLIPHLNKYRKFFFIIILINVLLTAYLLEVSKKKI